MVKLVNMVIWLQLLVILLMMIMLHQLKVECLLGVDRVMEKVQMVL
tara:strand:+ start:1625 stop:1762 length:138 start_codon:yes stop_codon:yes gene_type:complete